jgi:hypothetical protein
VTSRLAGGGNGPSRIVEGERPVVGPEPPDPTEAPTLMGIQEHVVVADHDPTVTTFLVENLAADGYVVRDAPTSGPLRGRPRAEATPCGSRAASRP